MTAFHRPILAELARRGTPFRGALYAGLMLTEDGPVLLECNARFGDPETQAVLPRLAVALGPLLLAAARGDLARAPRRRSASAGVSRRLPGASVAIVLAAAGYPDAPRSGDRIEGLDDGRGIGSARLPRRDHARRRRIASGRPAAASSRSSVAGATWRPRRQPPRPPRTLIHAPGLQRRHDIGAADAATASDADDRRSGAR